MRTLFFSLLSLVLTCSSALSQSDFRTGYVVLNSGDTLRGEINIRNNSSMSRECIFRQDRKSKPETFSPDEITEYRLDNGRYFVSKDIGGQQMVFCEFLVKGKLNLYHLSDHLLEQFYVQKEGDSLRTIPKDPEFTYADGKEYYNRPFNAIKLLSSLTTDAPSVQEEITMTDMSSQKELVRLATDYHNAVCNSESCIVYKKKTNTKVSVQPLVGYTRYFDANNGDIEFGSNIDFWMPSRGEHLYFRSGFFIGSFPKEIDSCSYVRIPIGLRYLGPSHTIRPEVSLGPDLYLFKKGAISLFNLSGALNICMEKDKAYWTIGGRIVTTPLFLSLTGNFDFISESVFTGFYFIL
jgi:hypothetical protein